ncbi:MAG: Rv3235 family protein [Mycobacterium sp.]
MLTIPNPPHRDAFAVIPVVDYEPPPRDVRHCQPPSPAALRRRNPHVPQRHSGRLAAPAHSPAMSAAMRQAASFADAALRRVLEVIDRRRPVGQLHGLLAAGLVDSVLSAHRFAADRPAADDGATAVLQRLRLQAAGPQDRFGAAEVFGTYRRGRRIHAVACRIELGILPQREVPPPAGGGVAAGRWQVVALHIG